MYIPALDKAMEKLSFWLPLRLLFWWQVIRLAVACHPSNNDGIVRVLNRHWRRYEFCEGMILRALGWQVHGYLGVGIVVGPPHIVYPGAKVLCWRISNNLFVAKWGVTLEGGER